jgi:predicted alpha-1,2-mannosidase
MLELQGLLRFVNTLQGTDSHYGLSKGNTLPLVTRPFGMNHWSAQTDESSNWFFSPHQRKLQGIRCTHQPSPWIGDYGHFTIMANTGRQVHLGARRRARAYKGEFHPEFFRAELLNDGTVIEMTPTERGAIFRFKFPASGGRVIFEPVRGTSGVVILDNREGDLDAATGWVSGNSGGVSHGFKHFFAARFDRVPTYITNFQGEDSTDVFTGERVGFFAEFDGDVTLSIATSFVSDEQAWANLDQEVGARTFEDILAESQSVWEANLGRIQIEDDDETKVRTFYSCLYRTQLFPRIWHEPKPGGGLYHRSPYSGEIHDGPLYTDNGFWDTYRTIYPLFALIQPAQLAEILQGWTNAYKEGGWFPQWASPGYRACMVGTHIDAVMADGIARGVTDFDVETALEGMLKHADKVGDPSGAWGRIGIEDYKHLGYVSSNHHESVARSLDYAYDDWCIAQVAEKYGVDVSTLKQSALSYKHLYDPEVGFMRAKHADGGWVEPWDEFHWGNPYVEGGPWQASWAVQHDPAGLIRLMGGEEAFVAKLDRLLTTPPHFTTGAYGMEIHEMTEMAVANFGQYAHSNQPVHHVLYLYNAAGRPWRTQKEARRVMAEMYSPTDLPGDEDNGEMSAWYVLSALGIFPQTPGHPSWTIGSPIFNRASVNLPNGKKLVFEATNSRESDVYVNEIQLDGIKIDRLFFTHQELADGGTIRFEMSDKPNESIVPTSHRPYSFSDW